MNLHENFAVKDLINTSCCYDIKLWENMIQLRPNNVSPHVVKPPTVPWLVLAEELSGPCWVPGSCGEVCFICLYRLQGKFAIMCRFKYAEICMKYAAICSTKYAGICKNKQKRNMQYMCIISSYAKICKNKICTYMIYTKISYA